MMEQIRCLRFLEGGYDIVVSLSVGCQSKGQPNFLMMSYRRSCSLSRLLYTRSLFFFQVILLIIVLQLLFSSKSWEKILESSSYLLLQQKTLSSISICLRTGVRCERCSLIGRLGKLTSLIVGRPQLSQSPLVLIAAIRFSSSTLGDGAIAILFLLMASLLNTSLRRVEAIDVGDFWSSFWLFQWVKQLSMTFLRQLDLLVLSKYISGFYWILFDQRVSFARRILLPRLWLFFALLERKKEPCLACCGEVCIISSLWLKLASLFLSILLILPKQFQQSMRNLKKASLSRQLPPNIDIQSTFIKDLEATIDPKNHLHHKSMCNCELCLDEKFQRKKDLDSQFANASAVKGAKMMKRILDGLTTAGVKSLKLYLPDIFFVCGQGLQIYQTNKQGRIVKLPGATPLKLLYPSLVRMRREYKSHLQQCFNRKMKEKIDTSFMHMKYYNQIVPPSFHAGVESIILQENKHHFKRYVLHNNDNYQIASLQEHKMNEKQPFCLVMHKDGNEQLMNQVQFEYFNIHNSSKLQEDTFFVQSYIKYKKQSESIIYSEYNYDYEQLDIDMDHRVELDVMILLGGVDKYDEGYRDLMAVEEIDFEMMIQQPDKYVQMMTYKIVHFLAMASRIYVNRLKIKWIVNDIGAAYLQEVMECATTEIPKRTIKYRVPKQDETLNFYNQSGHFMDVYNDLKKRRALNTLIIKKDIDHKTYEQLLQIMNPQMKKEYDERKSVENQHKKILAFSRRRQASKLYQTLDRASKPTNHYSYSKKAKANDASTYEQHLRQHPEIAMRNMHYNTLSSNRYSPDRSERVSSKIDSHFLYHMSSEDKKLLCNHTRASKSTNRDGLSEYLEKKKGKVSNSILYSTFSELSHQKIKQMQSLMLKERIGQKMQQNSAR